MQSLRADLVYSLSPGQWASESFGLNLYPWQKGALQNPSRQSIWLIHRQGGKSSCAGLKALHKAIYDPGLILLVSRAERQSQELFKKVIGYYDRLDTKPSLVEDKELSCTMDNGARIVSLPGVEDTVRCFSAPKLIIEDEASRCPDSLYKALRPMLITSHGELLLISTPRGKRGHFHQIWTSDDPNWQKIKVVATECPNISAEDLEQELIELGEWWYRQEYFCEFVDAEDQFFSSAMIEKCLVDGIEEIEI
jgi:hypothetical protein